MAFQGSFTDPQFGEVYPNAYFRPVQLNFAKEDKFAHILFYGFPDAVRAGKRIIGQKSYSLTPAQLAAYFQVAPADSTSSLNACVSMAYKLAKETKDTGTPAASFFNGFIDV